MVNQDKALPITPPPYVTSNAMRGSEPGKAQAEQKAVQVTPGYLIAFDMTGLRKVRQ